MYNTLSFLEDQIQKKFFSTTDACFHVKLMQGIKKIWIRLKSNEWFLSYQLSNTANMAPWAALFWAVLLCPQKGLVEF